MIPCTGSELVVVGGGEEERNGVGGVSRGHVRRVEVPVVHPLSVNAWRAGSSAAENSRFRSRRCSAVASSDAAGRLASQGAVSAADPVESSWTVASRTSIGTPNARFDPCWVRFSTRNRGDQPSRLCRFDQRDHLLHRGQRPTTTFWLATPRDAPAG